jgi:hypothetical protein
MVSRALETPIFEKKLLLNLMAGKNIIFFKNVVTKFAQPASA